MEHYKSIIDYLNETSINDITAEELSIWLSYQYPHSFEKYSKQVELLFPELFESIKRDNNNIENNQLEIDNQIIFIGLLFNNIIEKKKIVHLSSYFHLFSEARNFKVMKQLFCKFIPYLFEKFIHDINLHDSLEDIFDYILDSESDVRNIAIEIIENIFHVFPFVCSPSVIKKLLFIREKIKNFSPFDSLFDNSAEILSWIENLPSLIEVSVVYPSFSFNCMLCDFCSVDEYEYPVNFFPKISNFNQIFLRFLQYEGLKAFDDVLSLKYLASSCFSFNDVNFAYLVLSTIFSKTVQNNSDFFFQSYEVLAFFEDLFKLINTLPNGNEYSNDLLTTENRFLSLKYSTQSSNSICLFPRVVFCFIMTLLKQVEKFECFKSFVSFLHKCILKFINLKTNEYEICIFNLVAFDYFLNLKSTSDFSPMSFHILESFSSLLKAFNSLNVLLKIPILSYKEDMKIFESFREALKKFPTNELFPFFQKKFSKLEPSNEGPFFNRSTLDNLTDIDAGIYISSIGSYISSFIHHCLSQSQKISLRDNLVFKLAISSSIHRMIKLFEIFQTFPSLIWLLHVLLSRKWVICVDFEFGSSWLTTFDDIRLFNVKLSSDRMETIKPLVRLLGIFCIWGCYSLIELIIRLGPFSNSTIDYIVRNLMIDPSILLKKPDFFLYYKNNKCSQLLFEGKIALYMLSDGNMCLSQACDCINRWNEFHQHFSSYALYFINCLKHHSNSPDLQRLLDKTIQHMFDKHDLLSISHLYFLIKSHSLFDLNGLEAFLKKLRDLGEFLTVDLFLENIFNQDPMISSYFILDARIKDEMPELIRMFLLIDSIINISQNLVSVSREERKKKCYADLTELNSVIFDEGPVVLCLNEIVEIKNIVVNECLPMKSHAKVPLKIVFETTKGDHVCYMFKSNDDIRQDALIVFLFHYSNVIFENSRLFHYLYPHQILPTNKSEGLIEMIPNSYSRDSLGSIGYLNDILNNFVSKEKKIDRKTLLENFVISNSAYSILSWIFQLKDRHNGNILIDHFGHLLHIDFGFIFDISPGGNFAFETAPFKMSREVIQILGDSINSFQFKFFCQLIIKDFTVLNHFRIEYLRFLKAFLSPYSVKERFQIDNSKIIQQIIDSLNKDFTLQLKRDLSNEIKDIFDPKNWFFELPCFNIDALNRFNDRLGFGQTLGSNILMFSSELINNSIANLKTVIYDQFQFFQNNIEKPSFMYELGWTN
eukprot:TRINITY_DN2301_c0_g1_i1.p1 TRINITY_DN2301_c0_g1~~TRINITY_DN2301_c0_g1_i1.p1  ORF type:complete len:1219 (+),score=307.77 TRINITY_DN2301_c0_g1_i1:78-3734(+)